MTCNHLSIEPSGRLIWKCKECGAAFVLKHSDENVYEGSFEPVRDFLDAPDSVTKAKPKEPTKEKCEPLHFGVVGTDLIKCGCGRCKPTTPKQPECACSKNWGGRSDDYCSDKCIKLKGSKQSECEHQLRIADIPSVVFCLDCTETWTSCLKNQKRYTWKLAEESQCGCNEGFRCEKHPLKFCTGDLSQDINDGLDKLYGKPKETYSREEAHWHLLSRMEFVEFKKKDDDFKRDLFNLLDEELTKIPSPSRGKKIMRGLGLCSIESLRKKYLP